MKSKCVLKTLTVINQLLYVFLVFEGRKLICKTSHSAQHYHFQPIESLFLHNIGNVPHQDNEEKSYSSHYLQLLAVSLSHFKIPVEPNSTGSTGFENQFNWVFYVVTNFRHGKWTLPATGRY